MDAERFDLVAKAFSILTSRRFTLGALVAGALELVGLGSDAATKSPRCPRSCTSCERCERGRCRRRHGKKHCTKGRCLELPDDTGCEGSGRCLFGVCNPQPTCLSTDQTCTIAASCCSGSCVGGMVKLCAKGGTGAQCLNANDCLSGSCLGFRCQ